MSRSNFSFRQEVNCVIFGSPKCFGKNGRQLPTKTDVMRCCFEIRRMLDVNYVAKKEASFVPIAKEVAQILQSLYLKVSIPTVSLKRIVQLIAKYHQDYMSLKKKLASKTTSEKKRNI